MHPLVGLLLAGGGQPGLPGLALTGFGEGDEAGDVVLPGGPALVGALLGEEPVVAEVQDAFGVVDLLDLEGECVADPLVGDGKGGGVLRGDRPVPVLDPDAGPVLVEVRGELLAGAVEAGRPPALDVGDSVAVPMG